MELPERDIRAVLRAVGEDFIVRGRQYRARFRLPYERSDQSGGYVVESSAPVVRFASADVTAGNFAAGDIITRVKDDATYVVNEFRPTGTGFTDCNVYEQ